MNIEVRHFRQSKAERCFFHPEMSDISDSPKNQKSRYEVARHITTVYNLSRFCRKLSKAERTMSAGRNTFKLTYRLNIGHPSLCNCRFFKDFLGPYWGFYPPADF
jgi:hypothetical protein